MTLVRAQGGTWAFGARAFALAFALALVLAALASCNELSTQFGPADAGTDFDAIGGGPSKGPTLSCDDGRTVDAYPRPPYGMGVAETLANRTFEGIDSDGRHRSFALGEFFDACGTSRATATEARLLVLRIGAAWCGTCAWNWEHTKAFASGTHRERIRLVDVVVADEDNDTPTAATLDRVRGHIDEPHLLVADAEHSFAPIAFGGRARLPLFVFVDRTSMQPVRFLDDPDPSDLEWAVGAALADLEKAPRPQPNPTHLHDGRFHSHHWDMIHGMSASLLGVPKANPTNAKADDEGAASLGKSLFSDASLSPSGVVACAHCHSPRSAFQSGDAQPVGVGRGVRNAPSILFAAHARWQFWDGRADSLWSQALGPIENPVEMGSTRLFVAHAVFRTYKAEFEAVFGAMPPLDDVARFPPSGKPGEPSWERMAVSDRAAVDRVFVSVGKSLEAFERRLRAAPTALDRYAEGDLTALSDREKDGLAAFFHAGCAQCHHGPRLTDDAFHPIRFPTGRADGKPDEGRAAGIESLRVSPFRGDGAFSDAPSWRALGALEGTPKMVGAFKTPPLRGVADTAPYGHGGTLATFADVARVYSTAGLAEDDPSTQGIAEPWLVKFDEPTRLALPAFLEILHAEPVPP